MSRTAVVAILGLLMATGAFLRLHNLGARTFGHHEAYVPNVPLAAAEVSQPPERMTILTTLTGSMWEVHPPAWYLAMWPWTKTFGTSLVAIRFPQALLGILSILLTYRLVRDETDVPTGLLAAALLAVNGHHILWSQIGRPYVGACFLGLLSSVLLLQVRSRTRPRWLLAAYAVVTVCGLFTTYYYWCLAAAQIAWTLLSSLRGRRLMTDVFRVQMATVILSSPLISLAVFQSTSSYLIDFESAFFSDLIGFAFLFERAAPAPLPLTPLVRASYVVGALVFLAIGAARLLRTTNAPPAAETGEVRVSVRHLVMLSALAVMGVLVEALVFHSKRPARTPLILATALAPIVILAFAIAVESWSAKIASRSPNAVPAGSPRWVSLIVLLALVPVGLISLVSWRLPFFASRHMMIITPYLLAIIATGISTLVAWTPRPARWPVAAVLAIWLVTGHAAAYEYQIARPMSDGDFAGLARQWVPRVGQSDLIFVRPRRWRITPMFYYLQTARNRIIGADYEAAVRDHPGSVVWLVSTTAGRSLSDDVGGALKGYSEAEDIEVRGLLVRRFVPVDGAKK